MKDSAIEEWERGIAVQATAISTFPSTATMVLKYSRLARGRSIETPVQRRKVAHRPIDNWAAKDAMSPPGMAETRLW
jgi:hypothetical protein